MTDTYPGRLPDLAPEIAAMREEIRVPFRDGGAGNFSLEWCETGMRWLYKERPQVFMDMMYAIMAIEKQGTGRAKKAQ